MSKDILARARDDPVQQAVGLLSPGMPAGEDGQANEIACRQCIGVGRGIVGGGAGSYHQTLGVVCGQEIAAIGGIGVMTVERCLPGKRALEVAGLAGRLVQCKSGPDHRGVIGGEPGEQ